MPGANELLDWAKSAGPAAKGKKSRKPAYGARYAAEKRKWSTLVTLYAREQGFQAITKPAHFEFEFWEPNRKRDPDNMAFGAAKFILDALQDAKLLENDSWNWVRSMAFTWKQAAPAGVRLTVTQ